MRLPLALLLFAPSGGGSSLLPFVFQLVAIFGIFYFLMIRPQQTQRRQHEERLRNIKKGDEVVTAGGIVGEVVHIKEALQDGQAVKSMDDRITIKSGESRVVVERGRISKVAGVAGPVTKGADQP
jgi:preprotein translocase subunit YajC